MKAIKRLPEAEFEVMKAVWAQQPPVTTGVIMTQIGRERGWKPQTLISLMLRLVERGFLRTEKLGKERTYYPLVSREVYLRFETGNFVRQYHDSSLVNLVSTMYAGQALSDREIDELIAWAKQRRG